MQHELFKDIIPPQEFEDAKIDIFKKVAHSSNRGIKMFMLLYAMDDFRFMESWFKSLREKHRVENNSLALLQEALLANNIHKKAND